MAGGGRLLKRCPRCSQCRCSMFIFSREGTIFHCPPNLFTTSIPTFLFSSPKSCASSPASALRLVRPSRQDGGRKEATLFKLQLLPPSTSPGPHRSTCPRQEVRRREPVVRIGRKVSVSPALFPTSSKKCTNKCVAQRTLVPSKFKFTSVENSTLSSLEEESALLQHQLTRTGQLTDRLVDSQTTSSEVPICLPQASGLADVPFDQPFVSTGIKSSVYHCFRDDRR
eukprot:765494-Hanusia_phi.AAC.4